MNESDKAQCISLWPHAAPQGSILDGEGGGALLAAIAGSLTLDQRDRWRAQAAELLTPPTPSTSTSARPSRCC